MGHENRPLKLAAEYNLAIPVSTLSVLLLNSFRYCLGRKTYAVSECVDMLVEYWRHLPLQWQAQIKTDISRAIADGNAGMEMDIAEWKKILKMNLEEEL